MPCSQAPSSHFSSVLLQLQFLVLILSSQPICTMKTDVLSVLISVTPPEPSLVLSTWQAFDKCCRKGGRGSYSWPVLPSKALQIVRPKV